MTSCALDPEALGLGRHVQVVVVRGDVHTQHDLRREIGLTRRIQVSEIRGQRHEVGHGPFEQRRGERHDDVDARQAGVGDERFGGRPSTSAATSGCTTATPEVDGDHGALAPQLLAVAPEARLPSLDAGQAMGVVGVVPVAHVEPTRRVAYRAADAAERHGVGDLVDEWCPLRDAPVVRLQAEHPREVRRGCGSTLPRHLPRRWAGARPPPPPPCRPRTRPGCARGSRGCAWCRAAWCA